MRTIEEIKTELKDYCEKQQHVVKNQDFTHKIKELGKELILAAAGDMKLDRLVSICCSEREGRCVVLPCKIGDIIIDEDENYYEVTGYTEGVCEPLTIIATCISEGKEGDMIDFEASDFSSSYKIAKPIVAE